MRCDHRRAVGADPWMLAYDGHVDGELPPIPVGDQAGGVSEK